MGIISNIIKNSNAFRTAVAEEMKVHIEKAVDEYTERSATETNYEEDRYKSTNKTDLLEVGEKHIWTYAGVYANAANIASVPIKIFELDGKGEKKDEIKSGPYYDIINNPNPYESRYDIMEEIVAYLELTGDAYIEKGWKNSNDENVLPDQLWSLRPDFIEIKSSVQERVAEYIYKPNNFPVTTFDPYQIMHIKYFHPRSELYGLSPVQAAETSLLLDFNAKTYQKNFFKQGGMINMYLKIKKELSNTEYKRYKDELRTEYGGVNNHHLPFVIDGDGDLKDGGVSPDKIMLKDQLDNNRDELLSAIGTPPIVVNMLAGKETYNNAQTQLKAYWEHTALPKMSKIMYHINKMYRPFNYVAEWDLSGIDVLQEDRKAKAETGKALIESGQWTPNEVREKLWAMEKTEGGDTLRQPPGAGMGLFGIARDREVKANIKQSKKMIKFEKAKADQEKLFAQGEEKLYDTVVKSFKDYEKLVMKNVKGSDSLEKSLIGDAFKNLPDIEKAMMKDLIETESDVAVEFVKSTYGRITGSKITSELLKETMTQIDKNIEKWAKVSAGSVTKTMQERTASFLRKAIKQDYDIQKITSGIQKVFRGAEELTGRERFPWARAIARTETSKAGNYANYEAMRQSGVTKKQWIWSGLSRDWHGEFEAEGEVPIDHLYTSMHGKIKFPGDPDAAPADLVNCACTFVEVIDE